MKGLLLRLSALDPDAATAFRVIAHFEALLGARLDAVALVRSTAGLAECPAGLELADSRVVRFAGDGGELAGVPAPTSVSGSVGLVPAGRVWLERPGQAGPFDELILEWMAIAAQVLIGHPVRSTAPHVADPALVEVVISGREAPEERARALRLLGMAPQRPLRVVVVTGTSAIGAAAEIVSLFARCGLPSSATVRVAALGESGVALVQRGDGCASPTAELREALEGKPCRGMRVGVGGEAGGLEARQSFTQAGLALRFAVPGPPDEAVVDHDNLGMVALLAEFPVELLAAQPDVRALAQVAAGEGGVSAIEALAAFCRTGSLRQAAVELHLHHSSVAARLSHVEEALGWRLHDPEDRFRAQLALYGRRLATRPSPADH